MARSTLAENVAHTLRDAIYRGDYLSGERLVELALLHEMHVSQNTIRDALYLLEQQGLVVKYARRGVYVRAYSPAEAEEIFALWEAVESVALGWALPRLTRDDHRGLRGLLDEARRLVMAGNLQIDALLFEFHNRLGQRSGRAQTAALLENLLNQARLLENIRQMRAPRSAPLREEQLEAYDELLKVISAGRREEAQHCLSANLKIQCESLLPLL